MQMTDTVANKFPPLEAETRTTVGTDAAAYYLSRKPNTLRKWHHHGEGPISAVRVHGRLAWPVARLKELAGGAL